MAPSEPVGEVILNSCAYMIAHPHSKFDLKSDGSADVYFINESKNAFGLADGVGEWEQHGINPRFFPEELIFHCQNILEFDKTLTTTLSQAFDKTNAFGSSTVLLA
jgi:hypothetical protein